jgi:hypothetical protein
VRALLATGVVGLLLLGTGAEAGAHTRQTKPDEPEQPDQDQEPNGPRVVLVGQTPWVRPGEQMRLQFQVEQVPTDATVQLAFHDRLVTRGDFTDTLDGELGGTASPAQTWPLAEVGRNSEGTYELAVPIGGPDGTVNVSPREVYPVELLIGDAQGTILTSLVTYLVLLPESSDEYPPLNVAVVMEIGGPPGLQPDGTVEPDDPTVSHINSRIGALTQTTDVPLTVAPVPETLDALASWGAPGIETLSRLRTAVADREVLSRPYVDLDVDSLAAASMLRQIPPEAMAGARVLREQLHEPLEQTWLTGPTVGDAEVDALRDLGIGRVVVPESAIEGLADQDEGPVPVGPVELTEGGPLAAVSDDALATRLLGDEGTLDVQRFLAELTMIWLAKPSITDRAVVVRIPEAAPVEPTVLGGALAALTDGGAVRAIGMDEYFTLPPVGGVEEPLTVERTGDGPTTDLRPLTHLLEDGHRAVSGLAATLDDQTEIQSLHRSLLISLDADLDMAQRRAYIDRVGAVVNSVSAGVNAPPEFTITLTARAGTIPLTIENRTNQDVSVDVLLQSHQLEFPDGAEMKVNVPPGGRRIDLKVRTRTSGAFPLHITLSSPDRSVVYDKTTFTIRSTAVSGVGLVLSVGAGAFLLLWWARHWRTARRSRRLVGGDAPGPGSPPPGTPESALASLASLSSAPPPVRPAPRAQPVPPVPQAPPVRPAPPTAPPAPQRPPPPPPDWTGYGGTAARRDDPH